MKTLNVKNNGFGKIGDTIITEPSVNELAIREDATVYFNVDFNKGHDTFYKDHPRIVPVPFFPPDVIPEYQTNHIGAFYEAHARGIPFGAGHYSQFGINYVGKRHHYNYFGEIKRFKQVETYAILVTNGYSCVSRDSTTGQRNGQRGNVQPPQPWWNPIVDHLIGLGLNVATMKQDSAWDWCHPEKTSIVSGSMPLILEVLKSARLLISVETGILHLASATKTNTIYLSCATPIFFSRPDTNCKVVRAQGYSDTFSAEETIRAINEMVG